MPMVFWLNRTETKVVRGPQPYPVAPFHRYDVKVPAGEVVTEEHIRAAHGRIAPVMPDYHKILEEVGQYPEVVDGELSWVVRPVSPARLLAIKREFIDLMRGRAQKYQSSEIDGPALVLADRLVRQNNQKALEVDAWVFSIWVEFYRRKQLVLSGQSFSKSMLDFSDLGPMPHTVEDLLAEAGL